MTLKSFYSQVQGVQVIAGLINSKRWFLLESDKRMSSKKNMESGTKEEGRDK